MTSGSLSAISPFHSGVAGVGAATRALDAAAAPVASGDFEEAVTAMIGARPSAKASGAVIEAYDEQLEMLIELLVG